MLLFAGVSNQAGIPQVPLAEIVRTVVEQDASLPAFLFLRSSVSLHATGFFLLHLALCLIRFVRLLVLTLEVAVACMSRSVDQLVLLFDASK